MDKLAQLLALMVAANASIEELEGKRDGAEEDAARAVYQKEIDAKTAEYDKAKAEVERLKGKAARDKEIEAVKGMEIDGSKKAELADAQVLPDSESEHNALLNAKKLDDATWGYITDPSKESRDFLGKTDGVMIDAMRPKDPEKPGFLLPSYMRSYITGPILGKTRADLERTLGAKGTDDVLVRDPSGTRSGGGSLVPEVFVTELYKLPQITFRLVDRCRVKRAVGNNAIFPRLGQGTNRYGVVATWGLEGAAFDEDNPVFNELSISTGRLGLLTQMSLKELRVNAVGLQAELGWMFRGAWNQAVTQAILQGTGAQNRPFGVNTNASIALGTAAVPREVINQVSYNDLVRLTFAVEDALTEDGIFILQSGLDGAMAYVAALDDAQGRPVLRNEQTGWQIGLPGTLLGVPYFMTPDNLPDLGQRGDVIYGNWMNYAIAIDNDVTIDRSDHFAFDRGMVTFRMHSYIGGQALGPTCFSVLADVSTASSSSSSHSSSSSSS